MAGGNRWRLFFNNLCPLKISAARDNMDETFVFNFLRSFIAPYGVQHGDDMQVRTPKTATEASSL